MNDIGCEHRFNSNSEAENQNHGARIVLGMETPGELMVLLAWVWILVL